MLDMEGTAAFHHARRVSVWGALVNSLPTRELLDFQLAHARARDAVHFPFDAGALVQEMEAEGWLAVAVKSAARDQAEYLRRPDLGRRLDADSGSRIERLRGPFDVVFIVADGLSAAGRRTVGRRWQLLRQTMQRLDRTLRGRLRRSW